MNVGGMRFGQVWLGRAVRMGPGDGGTVFELLGRTRAGGYYRMELSVAEGEEIRRERLGLCLLERWFERNGYNFPDWIREEVDQGQKLLMEAGWDQDAEKGKVQRAQEQWREVELWKLEEEFLIMLEKPW